MSLIIINPTVKTISILYLAAFASSVRVLQIRPGVFLTSIKLFWQNNGTVSKFPPIIEYFVQRIQAMNSNYVHEDLSRPPTWEKPVYTLSPAEQLTAYQPLVENVTKPMMEDIAEATTSSTATQYEYEEIVDTTEKFYEIISTTAQKN